MAAVLVSYIQRFLGNSMDTKTPAVPVGLVFLELDTLLCQYPARAP